MNSENAQRASKGASRDAGAPRNDTPTGCSGNAAIPGGPTAGGPKGWYSRGYLPHLDQAGLYQSITFRLYDSVPAQVIERWKEELRWRENLPSDAPAVVTLRQRIVTYEDAGHGACWLCQTSIATLVENALLHFDGERYRLIAWCIMPNHVHVLIETYAERPLDKVLHSWKSFTAQQANNLLNRSGEFWAREYYDRYIRDEKHLAQTIKYIEQNPVKAGLVDLAEAWRFSSASRR
jgi:REP element-mobilizing transposase RayT